MSITEELIHTLSPTQYMSYRLRQVGRNSFLENF
jgi:hypothetical protein